MIKAGKPKNTILTHTFGDNDTLLHAYFRYPIFQYSPRQTPLFNGLFSGKFRQ